MDFTINEVIGNGTFGTIYKGTYPITPLVPGVQGANGTPVAIKVIQAKHKRQLHYEYKVYQILGRHPGIPIVHAFGDNPTKDQTYLVMQLF